MFAWLTRKYNDIVKIDKGNLPLDFRQQEVYCSLKSSWRIFQSKWHTNKSEKPWWHVMAVLCRSSLVIEIFQYLLLASRGETIVASGQQIETLAHTWYWVQILDRYCVQLKVVGAKTKSSVFSETKKIEQAQSDCAGSITSIKNNRCISCFSNSLTWGPARCTAEWIGRLSVLSISVRCCTALVKPKGLSNMLPSIVSIPMNWLIYADTLLE